jgi:hypothetical protein
MKIVKVELPAGEYWVGDPCYAVKDQELWMRIGASNGWFQESIAATVDDVTYVGVGTAFGDGVYVDQEGREFPVDAGLIGAVPVSAVEGEPFGMHRVTFAEPFLVGSEGAVIWIGDVRIDTGDSDVEDTACDECGLSWCECENEEWIEEEDE